jgi:hypothetical protein
MILCSFQCPQSEPHGIITINKTSINAGEVIVINTGTVNCNMPCYSYYYGPDEYFVENGEIVSEDIISEGLFINDEEELFADLILEDFEGKKRLKMMNDYDKNNKTSISIKYSEPGEYLLLVGILYHHKYFNITVK